MVSTKISDFVKKELKISDRELRSTKISADKVTELIARFDEQNKRSEIKIANKVIGWIIHTEEDYWDEDTLIEMLRR